jgi:hypothetical protein
MHSKAASSLLKRSAEAVFLNLTVESTHMRKVFGRLAAAMGLTVAAVGCGDRPSPLAPQTESIAPPAAPSTLLSTTTYPRPVLKWLAPLTQDYKVSKTVGLLGGTLIVPKAGLTVVIPPLALTKATTITITAKKGAYVYYEFQPHGLTFKLPVVATQLVSLTNANGDLNLLSHVLAGYLPNGQADISSTGIGNFSELFRITGLNVGPLGVWTTKHFSGYALAGGRDGDEDLMVQ